ncbi:MAG: hypothetical protein JSU06_09085 [Actinobacteria bacterium]|nr:hypothetical protein [Actinomycetota bacterium]
MRNLPYRQVGNTAGALAAVAMLVGLAGCGGGGASKPESALRKRLQAGAAKLTAARSFEASVLFELERESEPEEIGCLDLGVDNRRPARFDMRVYTVGCAGGGEASEVIASGNRAWATSEAGRYRTARIPPQLLRELDSEQTELKQLFVAAEDIKAEPGGAAVMEGGGRFAAVTSYSFHAPASAFPGSKDVGSLDVEFEAALDRHGYEEIDADLPIHPPAPAEVEGTVAEIRTRANLDALIGTPP